MDENSCRECGHNGAGGDSWDALCGRCADHAVCSECDRELELDRDGLNPVCEGCLPALALAA